MADYGRSRQTIAAAETIWRLWSDPSTWQDWNPNVQRMEVNGPFVNGASGIMHTPAGQHHQVEFTNIRPGQSFDLETTVIPLTHFTFHCEVVARGVCWDGQGGLPQPGPETATATGTPDDSKLGLTSLAAPGPMAGLHSDSPRPTTWTRCRAEAFPFASHRLQDVPPKLTSLVSTVPAARPGAVW